jgi:hypothetical protein
MVGGNHEHRRYQRRDYDEDAYGHNRRHQGANAAGAHTAVARTQQRAPVTMHTAADKVSRFYSEEQRLEEALARIKKRRHDLFMRELHDFELTSDPYSILGIEQTTDLDAIRRAYRRLALKYHPDKVSDPLLRPQFERNFEQLTLAYSYLTNKIEHQRFIPGMDDGASSVADTGPLLSSHDVARRMDEYTEYSPMDRRENVSLPQDSRFELSRFNNAFEEHRLEDPADGGYGDLIESGSAQRDNRGNPEKTKLFSGKFNRDIFNSAFDDEKRSDASKQVMRVEEPEALVSGNLHFEELGRSRPDDYGRSRTLHSHYTDYKLAHSEYSTLIDPDSVELPEHRSVKQLKSERSNVSYELSDSDRKRAALRAQRDHLDEQDRLLRLSERDAQVNSHFQKVNQLMLGGRNR